MPIFEYKCGQCGQIEEFLEKSGSEPKHLCPKCETEMRKQFSTFSPQVKQPAASSGKCAQCPSSMQCPNAVG